MHFIEGRDGHWLTRRVTRYRHVVLQLGEVFIDWGWGDRDAAKTYTRLDFIELYHGQRVTSMRLVNNAMLQNVRFEGRRYNVFTFNCSQAIGMILGFPRIACLRPEMLMRSIRLAALLKDEKAWSPCFVTRDEIVQLQHIPRFVKVDDSQDGPIFMELPEDARRRAQQALTRRRL